MARIRKPDTRKLFSLADKYQQNLLNRNILLIGVKGDEVGFIETRFLAYHFKHLTGVRTLSKDLSAALFFKKCVNRRLSADELDYDAKGLAAVKMEAASSLFARDLAAKSFGAGNGSRLLINSEEYAGHHWACIGFKQTDVRWFDPVTMLRSPIKEEVLPGELYSVEAVLSKRIGDPSYETFEKPPRDAGLWDCLRNRIDIQLPAYR